MTVLIIGMSTAYAEDRTIPGWIKTLAIFWGNDQVSDDEFLNAIEYLINNNIITVSNQSAVESVPTPSTTDLTPQSTIDEIEAIIVPSDAILYSMMMVNNLDESDYEKILLSLESWLDEDQKPGETITPMEKIQDEVSDIKLDWIIRQNSRYIDQEVFLQGEVLDVRDAESGNFKVLLDVVKTNFEDDEGYALVEYAGSRIRDGDIILTRASVSGIDVLEITDSELILKIKSDEGDANTTETEFPSLTASSIHVLGDPYTFDPMQLHEVALQISRDTLKEYREILGGSIVYFEGAVSSVNDDDSVNRINVSQDPSDISMINLRYSDDGIQVGYVDDDIERYDKVKVYGLAQEDVEGSDPVIIPLYIEK